MTAQVDRAGLTALVGATAASGSAVVMVKIAARGLPALTITVIQVVTAVLVLGGFLAARRSALRRPTGALVVAGVLEPGLAFPLINAGLARTSGTHGALIIGLESAFVVVLAALVTRTRLSPRVVVGLGLAVAGAAAIARRSGGTATRLGDVLVLAGVLVAAVYVFAVQPIARAFDPVVLTFYQFLFGGLAITALFGTTAWAGSGAVVGQPTAGQLVAALSSGLLGAAAAFVLYNWALRRVTATTAGIALTLIPVFGVALSAALLGEPITLGRVLAGLAVIIGIALCGVGPPATPGAAQ